jgi:iron complex outermembrane recepter protein
MFQKRVLPVMVALSASGALTAYAQQDALLEEIVVQGVRSAELNAREMERQKNIFSSVISQDDAGNFADQNVAEALQRLPGITLTKSNGQGEFVNLRGMGAGFVGVSMNNSELASASQDGRAVGLNTIPADLMGSIEVFKSLTPDMDLNSIAGRVNVNSVSAFDRGRDSLRLTVQGAMHEQRGQFSPKATLIGTKLLADETVGLAVSLSHEERGTEVNKIFNEAGLRYIRPARPGMGTNVNYTSAGSALTSRDRADNYFYGFEEGRVMEADPWMDVPRLLAQNNFEVRQEESERTRSAATFDFGWLPTTNSDYYLRVARTEYTDAALNLRENFNFGAGDARYIAHVDPAFATAGGSSAPTFFLGNADLQQRVSIEKAKDVNTTFTIGGENIFNELWTVDYEYHLSESKRTNPDDRRVQYRARGLPMMGQVYKDDITALIISDTTLRNAAIAGDTPWNPNPNAQAIPGASGFTGTFPYLIANGVGLRYQPNLAYDNLYLENGLREDEVEQIQLNIRRDFDNAFVNYVKAGVQVKERSRSRERVALSVNTQDFGTTLCNGIVDNPELRTECIRWSNSNLGTPNRMRGSRNCR